jgi:hypothetical protein
MDRKLIFTFVVILAVVAGIGTAVLVTAWTNPSGNPPTGSGNLSGLIGYFATSTCPTGWSEVTAARGRYIVGLPASGSVSSTVGTALSNSENRAVGQHTHTASDSGHTHNGADVHFAASVDNPGYQVPVIGSSWAGWYSTTNQMTIHAGYANITVDAAGTTAGTNAPYIQFIVCQKS